MSKKPMPPPWTKADAKQAEPQGWDVFEIWDNRIEYEIGMLERSKIFLTDEAARAFVAARGKAGDALALKALKIVFVSKCGTVPA